MRLLLAAAFLGTVTASAFAQQPAPAQLTAQTANKPAAVVNGEPISMSDVDALLKQTPMAVAMTEEVRVGMRRQAIMMLVDDVLMMQYLPFVDKDAVGLLGDFERGWEGYESRWLAGKSLKDALGVKFPTWSGAN